MNYLKLKQSSSSKWSANEDNRNPLCALNELFATHLSEYTGDWKYLWLYQLILLTLETHLASTVMVRDMRESVCVLKAALQSMTEEVFCEYPNISLPT